MEEVNIIIPVLDRQEIMKEAFASVKAQTYRPLHLVIVDNGSTDGSLAAAIAWSTDNKEDGFRISIVEEPRNGVCAARNRGLGECGEGKIMFFDSDDVMYPNLVEEAMKCFSYNPDTVLVFWNFDHLLPEGSLRKGHFTERDVMEYHLVHGLLRTHAWMTTKEYILACGGWDETLPVWNDYELGVRLILGGAKMKGINRRLYMARGRKDSLTGQDFSHREGEWEKSLDKVEKDIKDSKRDDIDRHLRIVAYRRAILAGHYFKEKNRGGADKIYEKIKRDPYLTKWQIALLRLAMHYTSLGLRGAWRLLSFYF